jgi:hypothetical protein
MMSVMSCERRGHRPRLIASNFHCKHGGEN